MPQSILSILILCFIVFFFATRFIPLGITAVLGATAMAAAGIITFSEAYSAFGSDTVLLVMGMIVVGNAITETGLTDILGEKIMSVPGVGKNERLFLLVVTTIVALLSGFMSNTATVAIFLPLIASAAKNSRGVITKKNTYMAVGIASILGGNLTLAGSIPQIVAQGILAQTEGCQIMGFFDLAKGGILLILVMLVYFFTVGYSLQQKKFCFEEIGDSGAIRGKNVKVDKRKTFFAGIIFLWCIVGFVFDIFTLGTVAVIAACACVVTGCISVERAASTMDWTSILVLGGSLGFSKGLDKSGALQMLAEALTGLLGSSATPYMMLCVFLILPALMGNFMSSTAVAAIIVPIAVTVAIELGINPAVFAIAVVIACSLSLATPVSTPPLTMTLSGGYRFGDYVVVGGVLNLLCIIVALITLPLLYGM